MKYPYKYKPRNSCFNGVLSYQALKLINDKEINDKASNKEDKRELKALESIFLLILLVVWYLVCQH